MLDAVSQERLTLQRLMELVCYNSEKLFQLPPNKDLVFVDLALEREVRQEELASKCGWSPYHGRLLRGWPCYTLLDGQLFCASQGTPEGKRQLEAYLSAHLGGIFAESR